MGLACEVWVVQKSLIVDFIELYGLDFFRVPLVLLVECILSHHDLTELDTARESTQSLEVVFLFLFGYKNS